MRLHSSNSGTFLACLQEPRVSLAYMVLGCSSSAIRGDPGSSRIDNNVLSFEADPLLERKSRNTMPPTHTPPAPFVPRPDPLPAMEAMLERVIELSSDTKKYPVTNGQLDLEQPGHYRYTFTLDYPLDIPDGTDLHLQSGTSDYLLPVELVNTTDDEVVFVVAERLSKRTLASASLVLERDYLLKKMKEGLSCDTTLANLADKLFGVEDCADVEVSDTLIDTIKQSFVPDVAQRTALMRSLVSELLLILGPAGTGKTDVLAAIALLHTILYKHRVLIVSHTNIAIDNAVMRLKKFLLAQGFEHLIEEHLLVRVGTPRMAELTRPEYDNITLEQIIIARVEAQQDEITRIEHQRASLQEQQTRDEEDLKQQTRTWQQQETALIHEREETQADLADLEAEEQERITAIGDKLAPLLSQDRKAQQTIQAQQAIVEREAVQLAPLEQEYQRLLGSSEAVQKRLKDLQRHHAFTRFFVQLFTDEWGAALLVEQEHVTKALIAQAHVMAPGQQCQAEARTRRDHAKQERKTLAFSIDALTCERKTRPDEYTKEKAAILDDLATCETALTQGNPRIAKLEHAIAQGARYITDLSDLLARLDDQMKDAKRDAVRMVIQEAQIVGTTLTSLYLKPQLLEEEWDVVILDEASMAPPPAVYIAARRAKQHLILVGDPLQLAPVCKIRDPKVNTYYEDDPIQTWLAKDVFFHGGYTLEEAEQNIHHSVLLPYQGRMHSDICDLIRDLIYKGKLKDCNPSAFTRRIGPEPDHAVVLYDTSHLPLVGVKHPKSGKSRFNTSHAELAMSLAREMLADMPLPHQPECLGIVTPYAAQRETIKDLVKGTDLEAFVRIGTIHAFQGLEFDGVIFDTTEAPGLAIAPFLRGMWGSGAMRLLNVAITRARHKLVIIAHQEHMHTLPSSMLLPRILYLASQKKCVTVA